MRGGLTQLALNLRDRPFFDIPSARVIVFRDRDPSRRIAVDTLTGKRTTLEGELHEVLEDGRLVLERRSANGWVSVVLADPRTGATSVLIEGEGLTSSGVSPDGRTVVTSTSASRCVRAADTPSCVAPIWEVTRTRVENGVAQRMALGLAPDAVKAFVADDGSAILGGTFFDGPPPERAGDAALPLKKASWSIVSTSGARVRAGIPNTAQDSTFQFPSSRSLALATHTWDGTTRTQTAIVVDRATGETRVIAETDGFVRLLAPPTWAVPFVAAVVGREGSSGEILRGGVR